ncbi:uncharacterized protein BDV14DRAFT_200665 [Aspergillus stella-maris]|uniref:uncharacterized protein n=1 Tax=Aspergillus stella-maris TaxID=1810926 RepID=UPI003CCCAB75
MDNTTTDSLSAEDPLSGPEFDGNGFDANEEVLLLQMTQTNQDAVSPSLQALLDDRINFAWPSGQRPQSPLVLEQPLVLERPKSRGVDTAAFSFAKPALNGKPFSLQPALKRTSPAANEERKNHSGQTLANASSDSQGPQVEFAGHPSTRDNKSPERSCRSDAASIPAEQRQAQSEPTSRLTTRDSNIRPGSRHEGDGKTGHEQPLPPKPQHDRQQQLSAEPTGQDAEYLALSRMIHEQPQNDSRDNETAFNKEPCFGPPGMGQPDILQSRPNNNQWKVVKRRHGDKRETAKRVAYAPSDPDMQVPEEALFQQLIGRLRAREESEAVATNMQKEMEANMVALREENTFLKEDLELLSERLQQRTAEARTYVSQTDSWKSKLAKVKVFLNELGTGYQNLRSDAIHFKATRKILDKERKEIVEGIEDVKERMSQIAQASGDKRACLTDAESLIASLGQELNHARERVQYSQNQLIDEKKRSRLLELHIQNCSRTQDKKLDLVKASQLEMLKSLESTIQTASRAYEASHTNISDGFERKFDDFLAQIGAATKGLSDGKMDVQQCREIIGAFEFRMDTVVRQLEVGIGNHSTNADEMMRGLEEQVRCFKGSLSEMSSLFEQLSSSSGRCSQLQTKLEETAPLFDKLELFVDALQKREVDLGHQMEGLETKLSEVKLPERFEDDYVHISVKLGLDNEMQQLNLTLKSTEEKLEAQQSESEQKQKEIRDLTANIQQADSKAKKLALEDQKRRDAMDFEKRRLEDEVHRYSGEAKSLEGRLAAQQMDNAQKDAEIRDLATQTHLSEANVARLETHVASLNQKIEGMERKAQDQLKRAIGDAKDRCASEFDQQLQRHLIEKAELEAKRKMAEDETSDVRNRLKEAENSALEWRKDLENLLMEREKRIQDLEALRAEHTASMAKQAAEIEQMRTRELTLTAQHNSLLGKFDEVHGRLNSFQVDLLKTMGEDQLSRKTQEGYFATLQDEMAKKREECQGLQDRLTSIQDTLMIKTKECQDLKDSFHATQSELAQTTDECKTLRTTLTSLQGKIDDTQAGHQTLLETLSATKGKLTMKEEEYLAASKKLEKVESARASLESGRSKAKAEIVGLLKRVQDSESDVKKVTEILHQMDVAQPGQPFPEILEQLKKTLQASTAADLAPQRQGPVQVKTPETSARFRKVEIQNGSYNHGEAGTDAIENGIKQAANKYDEPSPSKRAGTIVPFSSILDGLSPTHFSNTDESFDLSGVLAQTPVKVPSTEEPCAPAKPEKANPLATVASESKHPEIGSQPEPDRIANTQETSVMNTQERVSQSVPAGQGLPKPQNLATIRKVSFVTQKTVPETSNLQVPDSQEKALEGELHGPSLEGTHSTRTNRWTYSKRQREVPAKQHETMVDKPSSHKEDTSNKKAKTSSTTSAPTQPRIASELYGRRKSPTRLASGSSRISSRAIIPDQADPAKSRRRSARTTRGDKYNARFSQGA